MKLGSAAVFTVFCSIFRECLSQIKVVTFSSKSSEKLDCTITSSTQSAVWNEVAGNGSRIASVYTYDRDNGITPETPPGKYSNFVYNFVENTDFDLIIENVDKDDGGLYRCIKFPSTDSISYNVDVEALPDPFTLTCRKTPLHTCAGPDEELAPSLDCTCIATEVSPENLQLQWSIAPSIVIQDVTQNAGHYFNLINEVTVMPSTSEGNVTCSVTGYQTEGIDSNLIMRTYSFVSPTCSLGVHLYEDSCTRAELNCKCSGGIPDTYTYSFFFRNKSKIVDSDIPSATVDIKAGEVFIFYCKGCNGVDGESSLAEITDVCTTGTTTVQITTTGAKTGCETSSSLGLIVTCSIEGLLIVAMIFVIGFLYSIKRGWRKKDVPNLAIKLHDTTDNANSAYMDLQDTKISSPNNANAEVPYENLKLLDQLPGKGLVIYQRAQMITTSKREDIVVKTVSASELNLPYLILTFMNDEDDSPVRLEKLQVDEVRMLSGLVSNVNVVQFFGCCHKVPCLLCFEFVSGNNLVKYLEENFQRSKIHQYGNTKQKRFHVAEKGSVESLPRFALQIARGMKYLKTHKFLHPGLRSEKVIIDASGQCKLYDFVSKESAKEIIAILWGKSVPFQWMPPEYLFLEKLDSAVDLWSFGVVLWEIFSYGSKPYEGKSRSDVEKRLREKEYLEMPNNCPGAIWQIVLNCWEQSPEKRPSFDHLNLQLAHMCSDNKEYDEIHST